MIIDFHTHFYPEKIAMKAIASVACLKDISTATDGTADGLKASMRKAGIDYAVGMPLAMSPETVHGVNRWAASQNVAPIYMFGSIHPRSPRVAETVRWIADLGLKGIKMHPEYQDFSFSDRTLDPIWQACIDCNLMLLTHAGNDIKFPPPAKSDPVQLADLHRRFPALKLIIAHLGAWQLWDEVEACLAGLPVYFDLAFVSGYLPQERIINIIRKHGVQRVLFGTDSPFMDQRREVEFFKALPLTDAEKELIFFANAAALLNLSPGATPA